MSVSGLEFANLTIAEITQYLNFANIDRSTINQFQQDRINHNYNCASVVRILADSRGYIQGQVQNIVLSMFADYTLAEQLMRHADAFR